MSVNMAKNILDLNTSDSNSSDPAKIDGDTALTIHEREDESMDQYNSSEDSDFENTSITSSSSYSGSDSSDDGNKSDSLNLDEEMLLLQSDALQDILLSQMSKIEGQVSFLLQQNSHIIKELKRIRKHGVQNLQPTLITEPQSSKKKSKARRGCATVVKTVYKLQMKSQGKMLMLDESLDSTHNCKIIEDIIAEVKQIYEEKYSPADIKAAMSTYYKTCKDEDNRIMRGQKEDHRQKSRRLMRITEKWRKRLASIDKISTWTEDAKEKIKTLLEKKELHSSEYSAEDEKGKLFYVQTLPWQRKKITTAKETIDEDITNKSTAKSKQLISRRVRDELHI